MLQRESIDVRLLIIEDEEYLAKALAKGLRTRGYAVDIALDGVSGCEDAEVNDYDLLILDLNLPDMDGLEICSRLHASRPALRILILTGRRSRHERVTGLDAGADDYLVKPFGFKELAARVRALLRRDVQGRSTVLQCGDLVLDTVTGVVCRNGVKLHMTTKEFRILEFLMRNQGRIVSQEDILEHVWDSAADSFTNAVRVHVNSLRRKLSTPGERQAYLETVVGRGYRMAAPCPQIDG